MAFPRKHLNQGEEVVLETHPHWWYLAGAVAVVAAVVIGSIVALVVGAPVAVSYVLVALLVIALGWLVVRYLHWVTTSLVITNNRVIHRNGVLSKTGREIPLDHLTNIGYRQSFFERILRAGDVVLESAGRDSEEVFPALPRPASIQNEIYRQIDQFTTRRVQATSPPPTAPAASIPEQIEQLDELRRRGALTEEEFAAKKAELLQRM